MHRTSIAVLLACCLAEGGAAAPSPSKPAAQTPRAAAWDSPEDSFRQVFAKLIAVSGFDAGPRLAADHRGPTEAVFRGDEQAVEGAPVVALAARTGPNEEDHAVVIAASGLFAIVKDEDELAFVVGHGIAHLVLEHPRQVVRRSRRLFEAWAKTQDWSTVGSAEEAAAAFFAAERENLDSFLRGLERAADREGLALMRKAGFKAAASARVEHGSDLLWALRVSGDPDRDPILIRAGELRRNALGSKETGDSAKGAESSAPARPGPGPKGAADLKAIAADLEATKEAAKAARERFDGAKRKGEDTSLADPGARGEGIRLDVVSAAGRLEAKATERAQAKYMEGLDDRPVPASQAVAMAKAPAPQRVGGVLAPESLRGRGYTDENIADLERGIGAASASVADLHRGHPSAAAALWRNGTLANVEDALKAPFASKPLMRGCLSHQAAVLAGAPKDGTMEYRPMVIGGVLEHHAVVAYPRTPEEVARDPAKLENWWMRKGVVIDPWKRQSAEPSEMTFPSVDDWKKNFVLFQFMAPRLEGS